MSYILDALRLSDQQRRLGGVPSLPAAPVAAAPPERSPLLLHGLFGLTLMLAAVTTIAWLRPWSPAPARIENTAARPPGPAPAALPQAPAAVVAQPPRLAPPPAVATIAPLLAASPRKAVETARIEARTRPATKLATRSTQAATGAPEDTVGKSPSDDAAQAKPMLSSALPASIRKQLPPLAVSVHAWSNTPADRLVSINGRMLREGDTLAPDLRLEQITAEGMIFTYRGYRFQRNAQ